LLANIRLDQKGILSINANKLVRFSFKFFFSLVYSMQPCLACNSKILDEAEKFFSVPTSLFVRNVNDDDGNVLYLCRQKSAVPAGTKKKPGKFSKKKDEEKELKPAEQKPVEAVVAKKPKVAILTLCKDPGAAPRDSA
jgi:hypothetical protein